MRNLMVILATIAALSSLACPAIPTPTPTPTPITITHVLEIIADPRDAADVLLNPRPISGGRYVHGRTVTIDVLPKEGWQVDLWVGPVYEEVGLTAKIDMNSSQTVLIRLVRLETAPQKPITATAPEQPKPPEPPRAVHVDTLVGDYVMSDGDTDVVYLVGVLDSDGNPVSGLK